jgi:hypothetical protein
MLLLMLARGSHARPAAMPQPVTVPSGDLSHAMVSDLAVSVAAQSKTWVDDVDGQQTRLTVRRHTGGGGMLALELRDLSALGADLSGLGFTAKELAEALRPVVEGLTGEDEAPDIGEGLLCRGWLTFGASAPTASSVAIAPMPPRWRSCLVMPGLR